MRILSYIEIMAPIMANCTNRIVWEWEADEGTVDSSPMLAWIFEDEEYTEPYHEYFAEFITEYFESGYFPEAGLACKRQKRRREK